jgi:hypothetical protein
MSKEEGGRNSSFSEKPVRPRPRRLVDLINPTGAKHIHSSIDKDYKRKLARSGCHLGLPPQVFYREHGLVNLVGLIPALASRKLESS